MKRGRKEATVACFHVLCLDLLGGTEEMYEDLRNRLCRGLDSNFAVGLPLELSLSV